MRVCERLVSVGEDVRVFETVSAECVTGGEKATVRESAYRGKAW